MTYKFLDPHHRTWNLSVLLSTLNTQHRYLLTHPSKLPNFHKHPNGWKCNHLGCCCCACLLACFSRYQVHYLKALSFVILQTRRFFKDLARDVLCDHAGNFMPLSCENFYYSFYVEKKWYDLHSWTKRVFSIVHL